MVFTSIYNYFHDEEYFEATECINFLEDKIKQLSSKIEKDNNLKDKYEKIIKRLNLQINSIKYTYNI
jgi:hypothetical protein|tara:strand:- start:127 stop:327 length:201 start_codon:yes stop_codon:yes gene_type:complete